MRLLTTMTCLLCWTPSAFAQFTPIEAPNNINTEIGKVLREELARELGTLGELKANGAHDDRKEIKLPFGKKIVQITQFRGWVSLRFTRPDQQLQATVTQLRQVGPNDVAFSVTSSCPAGGHAHAGIERGPSIGSDFSANINLSVTGTITWIGPANSRTLSAKIDALNPSLHNLHFSNGIVNQFNRVAENAANSWAENNRSQLRARANEALKRTVEDPNVKARLNQVIGK
jgi:hypothetical protein